VHAFAVTFGVAATLSACAGRAQVLGTDEPSGGCASDCEPPDAGSSSRGGSGSSGSASSSDAGSNALDASGVEAGTGGEVETSGAPSEDEGGTGNLGGASAAGACASSQGQFATEVRSHSFGGGQNFNQATRFPQAILGPPVANDPSSVVSLGNGGWVVLQFAGNAIVDGPGADFTVFENPQPNFKELATVAVSDDAQHWVEFPCTAAQDAIDVGFCAGVGVVYSSPKSGISAGDPAVSGGDHYDLADISVTHARFVRITDRVDLTGVAGVFDLDAVAIVHAECP